VKVGAKMRMTFRIRDNDTMRGGFKRYFWKAAPGLIAFHRLRA
jgi:hypothetical protein